jgi:hypothetical protein
MQNRKCGDEIELDHGYRLSVAIERFGIHWVRDHALHDVRANSRYTEHEDIMRQQMVCSLETSLLAMDEDEFVAQWPENWWQHFRQRWFPAWWLKKHPVKLWFVREKKYGKVFLSVFPDRATKYQGQRMNWQCFDGLIIP